MNTRFKAIIGLVLLFAAGVITGVLGARNFQNRSKIIPVSEWSAQTLAEYRSRLGLTAGEEREVQRAVATAAQGIARERREARERIEATLKTMNGEILSKLDGGKQRLLKELLEEKRAKREAMRQ